jgi:hypothetical protein
MFTVENQSLGGELLGKENEGGSAQSVKKLYTQAAQNP